MKRVPRPRGPALFLCLLATLPVAGCRGFGDYVGARSHDLSDCVRARAGLGLGVYAEVEATSFIHPAVGFIDVSLAPRYTVGWDPRPEVPQGQLRVAAFPSLLIGWPLYGYTESRAGYGDTHPYLRGFVAPLILMGSHHVENSTHALFYLDHVVPDPRIEEARRERDTRLADHFWVAFAGTAALVTLDAGINLAEVVDFFAGIAMLDPLDDDERIPPPFRELDPRDERGDDGTAGDDTETAPIPPEIPTED